MEALPTRPVIRWHGGKWLLAPWIMSHFPAHRTYVEPFGGGASVLLRKPRSYAEIYNDLDGDAVNLFRVLRDPYMSANLQLGLEFTPFAREEFKAAYQPSDDPVERARKLLVRAFMGFGSNAHASQAKGHRSTGFRASSSRSGTTPAHDWHNYPATLDAVIDRLRGVIIENKDALDVIAQHDRPDTLFYVDPPYMHATRAQSNKYDLKWRMYAKELTDADHAELLERLKALQGMVVLSGYPHPLYDQALMPCGWARVEKDALADGARKRTEVLWLNPLCQAKLDAERQQLDLLEAAE